MPQTGVHRVDLLALRGRRARDYLADAVAELGEAFGKVGFADLTRARSLPVMLTPAGVGAALAWRNGSDFSWPWFALTIVWLGAGHLAANVLGDLSDLASGADAAARADGLSAPTTSSALSSGAISPGRARTRALALLLVATMAAVWIGAERSWIPLAAGAVAFALAVGSSAPRINYGSRVPFASEIAAVIAAGIVPCVSAYAVQSTSADGVALRAGVVPGLMLMLVFFHQAFLRHRSDAAIGRPSTVSVLGVRRAIVVSAVAAALVVIALLVGVLSSDLPAWAALAVPALLPLLAAYRRIAEEPESIHVQLTFLGAAVGSAALVNVVIALSLVADRAF